MARCVTGCKNDAHTWKYFLLFFQQSHLFLERLQLLPCKGNKRFSHLLIGLLGKPLLLNQPPNEVRDTAKAWYRAAGLSEQLVP